MTGHGIEDLELLESIVPTFVWYEICTLTLTLRAGNRRQITAAARSASHPQPAVNEWV